MSQCIFRVDASLTMGSGHVMRCLTLAACLQRRGVQPVFICRELPGNMCSFIAEQGYQVIRLPYDKAVAGQGDARTRWSGEKWSTDAAQTRQALQELIPGAAAKPWLIEDHYGLDYQWEQQLRPLAGKVVVIDDLADRNHDCDLLLDQNLYLDMAERYEGKLPAACIVLLGPEYVLLRSEFYEARRTLAPRDGQVRHLLIFFGSSDPSNETEKALAAVRKLQRPDIDVDVVVGAINPRRERIAQLCRTMPQVTFHCQVDNIAVLMAQADLAIGAGGTATWERCFLGLPTMVVVAADNQRETTAATVNYGAAIAMGWHEDCTAEALQHKLAYLLSRPEVLRAVGARAAAVVGGGTGGVEAVADYILGDRNDGICR